MSSEYICIYNKIYHTMEYIICMYEYTYTHYTHTMEYIICMYKYKYTHTHGWYKAHPWKKYFPVFICNTLEHLSWFSLKLKKFNTISKCNMATNFNTFLETYYLENLKSQKFEIENASLQYFLEIHRKKQYWVMPNVIWVC
jgi:hypothetical protein